MELLIWLGVCGAVLFLIGRAAALGGRTRRRTLLDRPEGDRPAERWRGRAGRRPDDG